MALCTAALSGCASVATLGSDSVMMTAVFDDALPIVEGNFVRASGVQVGLVDAVNLQGGQAHVVIRLEEQIPLHSDATASITANNLLGEKFIELAGGSPGAPLLAQPYVIPASQTRSLVDVLDVINSVDDPTAKALGLMLTSLGEGVDGQGVQAAAAIEQLAPSMRKTQDLAVLLDEQTDLLTRLVDNVAPVADALEGEQGTELSALVDTTKMTLGAVAAQRLATAETLRQLPETIAQARQRLAQLADVADPTTETLRGLRPVTDQLDDVSGELRAFSKAGDPALAALRPVLERGTELLYEARPFVDDFRPGADRLASIGASGRTLAADALGDRLVDLMEFMKGWSLATSDYDAVSHYFKAIVPASPGPGGQGVAGAAGGIAPDNPSGGLPVPTPPRPELPGREGGDSSAGKDNRAPGDNAPPDSSATGLTQEQEGEMLGQLLGGN